MKRLALLLLALPVLLAHLGVGEIVQRFDQELRADISSAPPPIEVRFVQEMKQTRLLSAPKALPRNTIANVAPLKPQSELEIAAVQPLNVQRPPEPAPVIAAAQDGEVGPEWPLSTRMEYTLNGYYRGEVTGSASVEWRREGTHYQMALELSIGGIVSRSLTSDGKLGPHGIEPQRYDETTKILLMSPRRATMNFSGSEMTLANGQTLPQPIGVQDNASQFVQLTWLFLTGRAQVQAGTVIDIPLALPRKLYAWRYTVQQQELLYTPMGEIRAWRLAPSRADNIPLNGDLTAEVWLAPTLQYLPVRILIRQDAQTYVDLMLAKPPVQAAPQSSPSKSSKP